MPGYDKYLQLEAEVSLLEDPGAILAAEIATAFAELECHDGFFRIHVSAADGVFLNHDENWAFPLFMQKQLNVRAKRRL
jgi:hypothetical protein